MEAFWIVPTPENLLKTQSFFDISNIQISISCDTEADEEIEKLNSMLEATKKPRSFLLYSKEKNGLFDFQSTEHHILASNCSFLRYCFHFLYFLFLIYSTLQKNVEIYIRQTHPLNYR